MHIRVLNGSQRSASWMRIALGSGRGRVIIEVVMSGQVNDLRGVEFHISTRKIGGKKELPKEGNRYNRYP